MTSVPDMGATSSPCGGISERDGFMAQARFIAGVYGGTIPEYAGQKREKESVRTEKRKEPSRFEEVVCGPLRCNALLGYLKGRGIPEEIARAECEEIRFRLYGKRYFAVGFRNMGGGYELRTRFMKWCLPPKDISLIRNGSLTCNLFEGFIDFLSWKVLGIGRGEDYLVLNSVACLNARSLIWTITGRSGATWTMTMPEKGRWPSFGNATVTGLTTVPTCMPDART